MSGIITEGEGSFDEALLMLPEEQFQGLRQEKMSKLLSRIHHLKDQREETQEAQESYPPFSLEEGEELARLEKEYHDLERAYEACKHRQVLRGLSGENHF